MITELLPLDSVRPRGIDCLPDDPDGSRDDPDGRGRAVISPHRRHAGGPDSGDDDQDSPESPRPTDARPRPTRRQWRVVP